MKEILFVAPTENVYKNAMEMKRIYNFGNIDIIKGILAEGLEAAKAYCKKYSPEILISRGGTYSMLRDAIPLPIVEIKVSASDCIAAYRELETFDEKVAIVGYNNVINDFLMMQGIIRGNFTYMTVNSPEEIHDVIKNCREQGITKIVGDVTVRNIANELNCTGILIDSQPESILLAMQQAESMLEASKAQIRKRNEIKNVIDSVGEAVFYTDTKGVIKLRNKAADKLMSKLVVRDSDARISEILPIREITEDKTTGVVCNVRGLKYIVNSSPTYEEGRFSGKVFSLQRSDDIMDFEQSLRRSADKKGFVAKYNFEDIIHVSGKVDTVIEKAKKFALVDSPILIYGESGTGKELLCQSIHNYSKRHSGPFVAINCAAISPSLIESELFGYEAGAFTNAHKNGKAGIFELAHNGTLFLDEISELPVEMQSRLLRAIQEKQVMRIGGEKIIPVNVRIICAANKDLHSMMKSGSFRPDLYFRVSILKLKLPALNDRPEDIIPLADYFLKDYSKKYGRAGLELKDEEKAYLMKRRYEGNIRELEGLMEESVVLDSFENIYTSENIYSSEDDSLTGEDIEVKSGTEGLYFDESRSLDENEEAYIKYIYNKTGCSVSETTAILGISRTTLWRKLGSSANT